MLDRRVATYSEAIHGVKDATPFLSTVSVDRGVPLGLIQALIEADVRDLTVVRQQCGGIDPTSAGCLPRKDACARLSAPILVPYEYDLCRTLCRWERGTGACAARDLRRAHALRGAGLGGFYTPVAAGTLLAEGKETRMIDGTEYVFERRSMAMSRC